MRPSRDTDTLTLRLRRDAPTLRVNGVAFALVVIAIITGGCAHAPAPRPAPPAPAQPTLPKKPPITLAQALAHARSGALEQARAELEQLATEQPASAEIQIDLGVLRERAEELDAAQRGYERALAIDPANDDAWDDLVRLLARRGRSKQAVERARADSAHAGDALALALLLDGQLDAAATCAKARLKADEHDLRAMQVLAETYLRTRKNELARMILANAHALAPEDARIAEALGRAQLALGSRAAALELFQKAAALGPSFPEAHANYGALLRESEDYDAAIHELELAVRLAPDLVPARIELGNAYRAKARAPEALAQFGAALRLEPENRDAIFDLALLCLDSELPGLVTRARLEKAVVLFEQFRKLGGTDPKLEDDLAEARSGIAREQHRLEREKQRQLRGAATGNQVPSP